MSGAAFMIMIAQVGVNRMALLHGPPGTGKTSLCRALANTLAISLTSDIRSASQRLGRRQGRRCIGLLQGRQVRGEVG